MLNLHLLECTLKGYGHISDLLLAKYWVITGCKYSGCTALETITLPAGIAKIDKSAFENCTALKTIYVPANKVDYYLKRLPWTLHRLVVEQETVKKAKKKWLTINVDEDVSRPKICLHYFKHFLYIPSVRLARQKE